MQLSENIYLFRTDKHMSQGDLADALDVSRQSVSKWENASAVPELDKLIKMSRIFDVTLDELVYGKTEQKPASVTAALSAPMRPLPPLRVLTGAVILLFALVFLLLSVFWGERLSFGEEIGELVSVSMVLLGVALMTTYNRYALAVSSIVYLIYAIFSYKIFQINTIPNHLFMGVMGLILFAWFMVWCHKMAEEQKRERNERVATDH